MALFLFRDFDSMKPLPHVDRHFGLGLCHADILAPTTNLAHNHSLLRCSSPRRPWQRWHHNNDSAVHYDKDQFMVTLDVQQFTPEEVQVKVVDNSIVVEAKHEEKEDEHGVIARQFVRKYVVPESHDIEKVASSLSSDGVLTIKAPKTTAVEPKQRIIPIIQTGPHKTLMGMESTSQDKKKEEN